MRKSELVERLVVNEKALQETRTVLGETNDNLIHTRESLADLSLRCPDDWESCE